VALDAVPGKPRLWSYARASCCAGTLSVTTLDAAFETRSIPLEFGDDPGAPGVGRDLNRGIFEGSHRIRFVQVTDYQPPLPPGGEWGK
jgi:hypothetical protein